MTLYEQMLETAEGCGIDAVGRRNAARLMAAVFVYGDESAVFNGRMHADIMHAARKYGLTGGAVPDMGFVRDVARNAADIMLGRPEWMAGLEERYSVRFRDWGDGRDGVRLPEGVDGEAGRGEPAPGG